MAANTRSKGDRDVVPYAAFGGLRNDVQNYRFEPSDLEAATNVAIDSTGSIARRSGLTVLASGASHSVYADNDLAVFAQGTALKRIATDLSITALATLTSSAALSFASVNGLSYFSNGTDTGVIESNAVRSWGLPVPAAISAVATTGAMPAGDYQFTAVYLRADGQQSGAGPAVRIALPSGGGLTFTIAASSNAAVTHKAIYLSTPNGDRMYLAKLITNATTTTTYALDTTELTVDLDTQFLSAPPPGQLVAYFQGRTYVAVGTVLYPSSPYGYELFDLREYMDFDGNITMLAPFEDEGIFVGTTKGVYWLAGKDPGAFSAIRRTPYGAIAGALTYVEGTRFGDGSQGAKQLPVWLSARGFCVGMPGGVVQNLTQARYDMTVSGAGAAVFMPDGRVIANAGSSAFALHAQTFALTADAGRVFNSLANFNGTRLGATSAGLYRITGKDDAGTPIASVLRTGITSFGTSHLKRLEYVWIKYRATGTLTLTCITDGGVRTAYKLKPTGSTGMHLHGQKIGQGLESEYWGFELSNMAGCDFALDSIEPKPLVLKRRRGGVNA